MYLQKQICVPRKERPFCLPKEHACLSQSCPHAQHTALLAETKATFSRHPEDKKMSALWSQELREDVETLNGLQKRGF